MKRLFLFLVILAVAGAGAWFWEQENFQAPGPSPKYAVVMINHGDRVATIARNLADAGVIQNADLFRLGLRLRNLQGTLKAGEFEFPPHMSMASVAGIIASGKSILHKLTAAEGLTSEMIFKLVQTNHALVGDPGAIPQEGTLLPETYLFTRGMTRARIIEKMQNARDKLLATLWPDRAANLPYTTEQEAITLASIVEKETAIPAERRHIAAVFANRLRLGMKLQSDPTIIYDITGGYPLGRGIRQSELDRASPHNTYAIAGLPPTPICNPGKDSIAAVLNPAASNDLYFVADGTGGHVFSATIAEHSQNVAKWRALENPAPPPPPPPPPRKHKLPKRHRRR